MQKMLKEHLPRVIYHQVYLSTKMRAKDLRFGDQELCCVRVWWKHPLTHSHSNPDHLS